MFECLVTREYNCLKGFPAQYRGYTIKGLWCHPPPYLSVDHTVALGYCSSTVHVAMIPIMTMDYPSETVSEAPIK